MDGGIGGYSSPCILVPQDVEAYQDIIAHPADVPIVVAAMQASVDYLVTLNRKHFIDDRRAAARCGLRVGAPGDALAWVRKRLARPAGDEM